MFHRTAIINRTANRGASLSELLFVPCPTDKDWRHVRQGQSGLISRWESPLPDFTRRELTAIAASAAISVLPGCKKSVHSGPPPENALRLLNGVADHLQSL